MTFELGVRGRRPAPFQRCREVKHVEPAAPRCSPSRPHLPFSCNIFQVPVLGWWPALTLLCLVGTPTCSRQLCATSSAFLSWQRTRGVPPAVSNSVGFVAMPRFAPAMATPYAGTTKWPKFSSTPAQDAGQCPQKEKNWLLLPHFPPLSSSALRRTPAARLS